MATGVLWYAQQAEVHISGTTLGSTALASTTQSLFSQLTTPTAWTGRCKDLSISGGSRDMTAENTLGVNQLEMHGRPEIMSAEFTLVYEDGDSAAYIAGTPFATANVTTATAGNHYATGTFTRYQYGEKTTAAADRAKMAVCFVLTNMATTSNKTVYVILNEAVMTSRELSLNSEGYVEEKWTVKCLAQNYYEEDNF